MIQKNDDEAMKKLAKLMNLSPTGLGKYQKVIDDANKFMDDLLNKPLEPFYFFDEATFMPDTFLTRMAMPEMIPFDPRMAIMVPSPEEIWAETMDLLYEIEERPNAMSRMLDEGCPNDG